MKLWMNARPHISPLGGDVERVLDAWGEGGVDGIVIGPLMSQERIALYEPDQAVYERFGVEPPEPPGTPQTEARAGVDRILASAVRRGWTIIIMSADSGAGPGAGGRARPDPG